MKNLYLPTYEDCLEILESNSTFNMKEEIVDGVKVSIFSYGLSTYKDFVSPIPSRPEVDALEIRGLSFVHEDCGETTRYLALRKFFNVGQVEGSMYEDIKDKTIFNVQDKADGSMISFVKVRGRVVPKTKKGFTNEQAMMVRKYLSDNPDYLQFVEQVLNKGIMPVFELVSPYNLIVLKYPSTELHLLQLRDLNTGEYLDIYKEPLVKELCIETVSKFSEFSLEDLMRKKETDEGVEGWVVTFEDGFQVKVKTNWYMILHKIVTESFCSENYTLEATLTEILDDALAQVEKDNPVRLYAERLSSSLIAHVNNVVREVQSVGATFDGDRKSFALKHKDSYPHFSLMMCSIDDLSYENIYENYKNSLFRKCRKLSKAQEFAKEVLGIEKEFLIGENDEC